MNQSFSQRNDYNQDEETDLKREEAPKRLRAFIQSILIDFKWKDEDVWRLLINVLGRVEDHSVHGFSFNVREEVDELLLNADWCKIYDFIERVYQRLNKKNQLILENDLNIVLGELRLGWKFNKGHFEFRGSEKFEQMLKETATLLSSQGLQTTQGEIKQALHDMTPLHRDITGAIQHSMAALECLAREKTGSKETLGTLLKRNPTLLPRPLSGALEQIYGYASNNGRHLLEGKNPQLGEAELVVNLSVSLCRYLAQSIPNQPTPKAEPKDEDLPF